ncbi:sugar ABC transporter ATP-binding protein [Neorhizobium sp. JUb45]|uniref:sugar ABC transporter ATP-binding protein n=2 Tax=unclassified Neorhizobium TaxID=2629175 RepID=UPI0010E0F145|nr:sugar ABC transporter ATP-binding protein [Neorhizobium sp. JUb45]TCR02856.1 monosaccharide ABC transporter ATP-binding protein (CUT2 family) [Neorhizobium sp. JUb45]
MPMQPDQTIESPASSQAGETILSVRNVSKTYGKITVLKNVSFDIKKGEVVALLGENGAGKSTLSSIIAGLVIPSEGEMRWQGEPYSPATPSDALNAGLGLIHQEMRLLPELSIAENIFVGRLPTRSGRIDNFEMYRRADEQLKRLGLNVSPATKVKYLRVAAQQQVEIAKALTLNARFLILDEPTAALGGEETDKLFEQIERLKNEGVSFIYISHRLEEIARIADRVIVMRDGELVANFDSAKVPVSNLVEAMVGRQLDRIFPHLPAPTHKPLIEVKNLSSAEGDFHDVSFTVSAGEVMGIAGIVGAGRTELVRAIAGADPVKTGSVSVDGKVITLKSPADAMAAGIALVPEDRKLQGLVLEHTIGNNIALGNYPRITPRSWVTPTEIRNFATTAIKRFGIKGSADQRANELSGGNQQKIVIARAISAGPKVVILDEPTRGIDVGARSAIYDVIAELAKQGMAVIVVSSDLDEVLGLSHKVLVMARGRNQGILSGAEATRHAVMERATA